MKHPIIVYAIADGGKGIVKKIGKYNDVEKIHIKIKDYSKDTIIELEQYFTE
jgi:glycerate kinase